MFGWERKSAQAAAKSLLATGLAFAFVLQSAAPVAAAAGELDDEFDGNGKLILNTSSGNDYLTEVAIQPGDQKIVAVGRSGASDGEWMIIRLDPDGSLDSTFGGGDGKVNIDFSTADDYANALAIQDDGKIVVVGLAGGSGGRWGFVRLDSDGTLDNTFSGDGRLTVNFTTGQDIAGDVVLQVDQRIVVTGFTSDSDSKFTAVRIDTDGTLDDTFSGDGIATANLSSGPDLAFSLGVDTNGKIVLGGYASGSGGQVGLVRFRTTGSLDGSFSGDGKLKRNYTSGLDYATGVVIQPANNKIVMSGISGGNNSRMMALRFNADATPDSTFSQDGVQQIDVTVFEDNANSVAIQGDGKIVLAGSANYEFFTIVRLTSSGALDTSFGDDGVMFANVTADYDVAFHVGIQADGDIVAVGTCSGSGGRLAAARFLAV